MRDIVFILCLWLFLEDIALALCLWLFIKFFIVGLRIESKARSKNDS